MTSFASYIDATHPSYRTYFDLNKTVPHHQ